MFTSMLYDTLRRGNNDIYIECDTDGGTVNWRILLVKTKVLQDVINRDFMFADNGALNNGSMQLMQIYIYGFSHARDNFSFIQTWWTNSLAPKLSRTVMISTDALRLEK